MNNEKRLVIRPATSIIARDIMGRSICHGWSNAFFGWNKPKPVEILPPAPEQASAPDSAPSDPKPLDNGAVQNKCPAPPEAIVERESAVLVKIPTIEPGAISAGKPERSTSKRHGSEADLVSLVPLAGRIPKKMLIDRWCDRFTNHQTCREILEELITNGTLFETKISRPRTNPEKFIARGLAAPVNQKLGRKVKTRT